jgi:hypothetical protein
MKECMSRERRRQGRAVCKNHAAREESRIVGGGATHEHPDAITTAATQYVAAVRANYEAGKATFLDLAQSNRQPIMMQEREIEAVATLHQRRSQLDRNVGEVYSVLAGDLSQRMSAVRPVE